MKFANSIFLTVSGILSAASLQAAVLAEWTFNTGATSAARLASSNVALGASVSGLSFNTSFDDFGPGFVPNSVNDGFGFGGNLGDQVIFLHRANYFDGSPVPSPRPTVADYTAWGNGSLQGTGGDLNMDGNAPISFTVTSDANSTLTIDSITVDFTSGGDIIFQIQEAGASVGPSVTLSPSNPLDDVLLASPVLIAPGQTKTFTINVNSGNLNSLHNLNGFSLNGTITPIPEPSVALLGALGALSLLRRSRD